MMPRWGVMWAIAFTLYAACKWLTYREARARGVDTDRLHAVGYLLFWPGMDADAFLSTSAAVVRPASSTWLGAVLKTFAGVALVSAGTRAASANPLAAGWIGMVGLVLFLHFGTFDLLSLGWRSAGVNAMPVMRSPLRSASLAEFWGRRWNTAFHELANRFTFRPLRSAVGAARATLLVFLLSGLIHELVISVPAGGGYGLPTMYFALQGAGVAAEHTRPARALGLGRGWRGRVFTVAVAAGPAFWLFSPLFVRNVIVPMLASLSTLGGRL